MTNNTEKLRSVLDSVGQLLTLDVAGGLTGTQDENGVYTIDGSGKQNKLTGTAGQVVGFDINGNAVAQELPEQDITVDTTMSDSSTNAVQNKVIKSYVDTNAMPKVNGIAGQVVGFDDNGNVVAQANESDIFLITATIDDNNYAYVPDKTFGEVKDAYSSNKTCILMLDDDNAQIYRKAFILTQVSTQGAIFLSTDTTWDMAENTLAQYGSSIAYFHYSNGFIIVEPFYPISRSGGTFSGSIYAGSSSQTPAASLLRNSKLVSTETTPTVNGEIYWTYE